MDIQTAFSRIPFLSALPTEDQKRLMPYAEIRTVFKGEKIWADGNPTSDFTFVIRGRVKMVKTAETGKDTILELSERGEMLCASAVCGFAPYCCSAVCMEDGSDVLTLPRRDLLELADRNPQVARAFVREVTCRGMNMCQRVEELSGGRVEQRIAMLLLKLADRSGVPSNEGIRIPIPLSRQDLADLCGTTVETAIRTMSKLAKAKIVESAARGFMVRSREDLEGMALGRKISPKGRNGTLSVIAMEGP